MPNRIYWNCVSIQGLDRTLMVMSASFIADSWRLFIQLRRKHKLRSEWWETGKKIETQILTNMWRYIHRRTWMCNFMLTHTKYLILSNCTTDLYLQRNCNARYTTNKKKHLKTWLLPRYNQSRFKPTKKKEHFKIKLPLNNVINTLRIKRTVWIKLLHVRNYKHN
jgi:hypothetical protein